MTKLLSCMTAVFAVVYVIQGREPTLAEPVRYLRQLTDGGANSFYLGARPPLKQNALMKLSIGSIRPEVLSSLANTVSEGANWEKAHRAPGIFALLRRLRSENSRHALAVALDLVESVGKGM